MTAKEYCTSHDAIAYYSGLSGLEIHGTVIVTGYAPFGNVKPTYTVIENYNKKLVPIVDKYRETVNYERFISEVQELVKEFAVEVTDRVCPF